MAIQIQLDEIYAPVEKELSLVEDKILDILKSPNELSEEVIHYFFKSKGKFLRPALTLLGASSGEPLPASVIQMAAALEIFHSATLIHDDIIDSAYIRRNVPTVNAVWGPQVAVLVGDYLHDKAIGAIFELKNEHVTHSFLETAGIVCDGEILELKERGNDALAENQYFTIVEKKTAALLACCLETGALLAGKDEKKARMLKEFGINFGIAFQIIDDYLDFAGKENEFGKTLGADCLAGVLTLPLIRLISIAGPEVKSEVLRLVNTSERTINLEPLLQHLQNYEALDYTVRKAKEYAEHAKNGLSSLKESVSKKSLLLLLDYVLERNR